MKIYYNKSTNEWYTEGNVLTRRIDKGVFSGIPSEKRLKEWGFEEYIPPTPENPTKEEIAEMERQNRMSTILQELQSMDYLTSKYVDGEDMSAYGDWQERRKQLRAEYRELEEQANAVQSEQADDEIKIFKDE